jgi:hypothetical protein
MIFHVFDFFDVYKRQRTWIIPENKEQVIII